MQEQVANVTAEHDQCSNQQGQSALPVGAEAGSLLVSLYAGDLPQQA